MGKDGRKRLRKETVKEGKGRKKSEEKRRERNRRREGAESLTALQACLFGVEWDTGRCPVLCSLRAYSPRIQCGRIFGG